jgi:hypothetical protein
MMMLWSLVSWTQAWMTGRASFYVTRALIGAFEGGFIPGTILFATYFYKTRELSVRLAFFWSTLNVSETLLSTRNALERGSELNFAGGADYFILACCGYIGDAWRSWKDGLVLVVPY